MQDPTPRRFDVPGSRGSLSYYGLRESPFLPVVKPEQLWLGAEQRRILATLTTAIRRGGGVVLLTGDIGSGKTSLANALLADLSDGPFLIGKTPDPSFNSPEFFTAVTQAFGMGGACDAKVGFLASFQELLSSAASKRKRTIVVVDEAHRMSPEVFEDIQDLSEIGTAAGLTIVLVGQEELRAALSGHPLAALRRRIVASCVLHPLTAEEVGQYIRHRLALAGAEGEIFSRDAIRAIASISRGAPGIINVTCDGALLTGYQRQARTIRGEIIEDGLLQAVTPRESADEDSRRVDAPLEFARRPASGPQASRRSGQAAPGQQSVSSPKPGRRKMTPVIVLGLALIVAGYGVYAVRFHQDRPASGPSNVAPAPTGEPGDRDRAAVQEASDQAGVAGTSRDAPPPIPSATTDTRERSTDRAGPGPAPRAGREVSSSATQEVRPRESSSARERAGAEAGMRRDVVTERPGSRAASRPSAAIRPEPEKNDESYDPAAIIDWLVEHPAAGRR
jgi:type II secretory pathway predicted ATPase ExeA